MSEFNFKSQICTDKNQSERLLALGLKKETADMALHFSCMDIDGNAYYIPYTIGHQCNGIPAWSLHRLMCLVFNSGGTHVELFEDDDAYEILMYKIEMRIKEGYFNKEYLVNQAEIEEHCKGVLEYLDYIKEEEE